MVDGALVPLTEYWNYEQWGTLTPKETAEIFAAMLWDFGLNPGCDVSEVPTPFWDEASDLDDQEPADVQEWYGYVTEPEAPADELTFIENVAIWGFTGFIAYAGDIGAALFFRTIAKSWVLAWRRGSIGEVIRVIVDGAEYGRIDTTSAAPGDLVQMPVIAGDGMHDITMIKVA